jgi:hypothetical protein
MQRSQTVENKSTSPSVSGEGALNEYDVVPCLKLDRWPAVTDDWQAKDDSYTIGPLLRQSMVETTPILLVPTGNPLSPAAEDEWRLSFSFVEIEIFNHLLPRQRQLYGLLKYLFKELFNEVDLLSSYHVKTLMLWKVDHEPLEYWERVRLIEFIVEMFREIFSAIDNEYIPHLFISGSNIFPLHKTNAKKKQQYKEVAQNGLLDVIILAINKTLIHDLTLDGDAAGMDLLDSGSKKLKEMAEEGVQDSYVSGYLTRLLSVSWYCLQETALRGTLHRPITQLKALLERYKDDKNIQRLLPMLEVVITSMTSKTNTLDGADVALRKASEADQLSTFAHLALTLYLKHEYTELKQVLVHMEPLLTVKDAIGVTVTKLQANVDYPVDYLTAHVAGQLKSNRLYLEPRVLYLHLHIQLALHDSILATEEGMKRLQILVKRLTELVEKASDREPYLGKLSYKHAEIILLRGYTEYFRCKCEEQHGTTIVMPKTATESSLKRREFATNFNLR